MHVVVTGGAGFIGSNVAAAYLDRGERVTVLDALRRPGTERNLEWLRGHKAAQHFRFVRGDVRDPDLVREVVGARDVDLVFHFAAQPAVTTSVADPREDLSINLLGTFNALEAVRMSRAAAPPSLFFTSTNKVYGALPGRAIGADAQRYRFEDEKLHRKGVDESEPLDFHSPYGCSKGAADQYVRDYARIYGLRTCVFRMSCIYGTRQFGTEDQGWLAHFAFAAANHRGLTIYGDGKQVRDLLFVDDLVRAFQSAADAIARTAGRVYNIGGGPPRSVSIWQELGPRLERLAGHPIPVTWCDWRPGDQLIYVTDTSAARADFGWEPKIDVEDGLERLWRWVVANVTQLPSTEGVPTVTRGPAPHAPRRPAVGLPRARVA